MRSWCSSPNISCGRVGPRSIAALDSISAGLPATLNLVVSLAAVLAVSHFTYLYVEIPGGKLLRNVSWKPARFLCISRAVGAAHRTEPAMTALALQRPRITLISLNIEAIALGVYLVRDAFGGVMRYYTSILHLDRALVRARRRLRCCAWSSSSCIAFRATAASWRLLVLVQIMLSLVLGYFMMGTANAAISAFKMMLPVFVGFCFCDANLGSYRKLLSVIAATFYLSIIGVLLTKFYPMPWVGFKYESFGAVREAGRLWWAYGGDDQRLMGFAADNTMAAFFILVSFAITSIRKSTLLVPAVRRACDLRHSPDHQQDDA